MTWAFCHYQIAFNFRFDADGQLQYRRAEDWQSTGLRVKLDQWNVIHVAIETDAADAEITLNDKHTATLPVTADVVNQVEFRVDRYGLVLLDALRVGTP